MRLKNAYKKAKHGAELYDPRTMEGHIVGMGNGGKKLKYTPAPQGRVYNDNTRVVTPSPITPLPTAKTNITTLVKDKAYQLPKYESKKEAPAGLKRVLGSLDKATDYMQMAHFIPDPTGTSQVVGTLGDVVGVPVDLAQSAIDTYEGDYGSAAGNLALAGLTMYTGYSNDPLTGKIGNGYKRPVSIKSGKGASGTFLNKPLDSYRPLSPVNPNINLANAPALRRGLNYNKATLAGNLTELGSNTGLPDMPSTNAQTSKEYKDNAQVKPLLDKPEMKQGGDILNRPITCSSCGHSWTVSDSGPNPLSCHNCGGVAKMQMGGLSKMPNGGVIPIPLADYDKTMAPKKGNYLLPDINRPSYIDSEGGRRSEYKGGYNLKDEETGRFQETLIPTVVNGKQLTDDEAIQRYKDTGLHMGKYETPHKSEYASRLRTAKYNMLEDPVRSQNIPFKPLEFKKGGKVDHSDDKDMVNGVSSILRRVKDKDNRLQLAHQMSSQFNREKVKYNLNDFLNKSKVKK